MMTKSIVFALLGWVIATRPTHAAQAWSDLFVFDPGRAAQSYVSALALDETQSRVYFAIDEDWSNSVGFDRWIVKSMALDGSDVRDLDTYRYAFAQPASPRGLVVASGGRLVVSGSATDAEGISHWLIRTREAGKVNAWKTTLDYRLSQDESTSGWRIARNGPVIHAIGWGIEQGRSHWLVQRSNDNGSTWGLIDDFRLFPDMSCNALGVSGDLGSPLAARLESDPVFVSGSCSDSSGRSIWMTRKLIGENASTVDAFQSPYGSARAGRVLLSAKGVVIVAGNRDLAPAVTRVMVRRSSNFGKTWQSIELPNVGGISTTILDIAEAEDGQVYVSGYFLDAQKIAHLILLQSKDQGISWRLLSDDSGYAHEGADVAALLPLLDGSILTGGWKGMLAPFQGWLGVIRRYSNTASL